MKKLKKKTKLISRGKLIKLLDSIFSRYVRLLKSTKGHCICKTCNSTVDWKNIQNWHFVSRKNYKYRWDINNCFPQCYVCNVLKHWNYQIYTLKMIEMYGKEKVEEILNDKELVKISTPEIKEKIEYYTKEVDLLFKNLYGQDNA